MPLSAWTILESKPSQLLSASLGLEKDLEDWIAADPALVDRGFVVLKRQINLGAAGRLDLLCVDQQGRLAIVEIKRGSLVRDTIAQALDYASVVASWSAEMTRSQIGDSLAESSHPGVGALLDASDDEAREVEVVIVGCGADASVDRMIEFLGSRFGVPIRAVTFEVFTVANGQRILVREEREAEAPGQKPSTAYSIESVITKAGGVDSPGGRRVT